ncbi:MAG: hypothetical protein HUK06_05475 [Bacteroidaceae bacterium]|nr:hypothetical protein [Bacteroidaceae bacterium]
MSVASIAFVACFFTALGVASVYACKWVSGIKKEWTAPTYIAVMLTRFLMSLAMVAVYCWKIAETHAESKTFALVSVGCYFLMLIVTTLIIRKLFLKPNSK